MATEQHMPEHALEAAADAVMYAAFGQELPEAPIDLAKAAVNAFLGALVVESPPYWMHCTDRNPDHCACATETIPECVLCGETTEGHTTLDITRQVNPFIDPAEPMQDWETISRHKNCDDAKEENHGN